MNDTIRTSDMILANLSFVYVQPSSVSFTDAVWLDCLVRFGEQDSTIARVLER